MNEWAKILIPILITAMGILVANMLMDIKNIKVTQIKSEIWMYRVEQNELKIKHLEEKIEE